MFGLFTLVIARLVGDICIVWFSSAAACKRYIYGNVLCGDTASFWTGGFDLAKVDEIETHLFSSDIDFAISDGSNFDNNSAEHAFKAATEVNNDFYMVLKKMEIKCFQQKTRSCDWSSRKFDAYFVT